MISVFGYYSCGGYKDMYLGNSKSYAMPTYYLPLLGVMKAKNKPAEADIIKELEALPQIAIMRNDNSCGFPEECSILFSHGAYLVIYKTLQDGRVCLSVKDVPGKEKDELERDIPFNLLFIAEGEECIRKIDNLALSLKDDYVKWINYFSGLFSYDYKVNGIKFDLPGVINKINTISDYDLELSHNCGRLTYLMVSSIKAIDIAFKEQKLNTLDVACILDFNGNILRGSLTYNTSNMEDVNPIEETKEPILDNSNEVDSERDQNIEIKVSLKNLEEVDNNIADEEVELKEEKIDSSTMLNSDIAILKKELDSIKGELSEILQHLKGVSVELQKENVTIKEKDNQIDRFPFNTKIFAKIVKYKDYYLIISTLLIIILLLF